ncbi:hypothetical protein QM716_08895 [Rhodococcus sp. IEGM 1409]|uniref:hypothetical protein n=1 Tax=Rhodococcus sp. IEGM 1409 TaxID=3047082 RepID=UPI0024B6F3C9|nr:hypothetical protein [Rhodococcus sp. IEGM 1409]MDI9899972.1 hypothetical protein [Rhodococcus sp. IEGM 1409]
MTTTVVGWLWWTKSIAFMHTAVVQFGVESTEPDDGTLTAVFIDVEASELDLTKTAERLARTRGGSAAGYESDLTVTSAVDVSGLAVTARGRTPGRAQALAIAAAEALSSYLSDVSPSGARTFTYTVVDQGN